MSYEFSLRKAQKLMLKVIVEEHLKILHVNVQKFSWNIIRLHFNCWFVFYLQVHAEAMKILREAENDQQKVENSTSEGKIANELWYHTFVVRACLSK